MKGFVEDNGQSALYLSVKHHSIVEESKREREGFTPINIFVQRTGETITKFIKRYKAIEGFVKKIEYRESEFDGIKFQSWKVHLVDDEGRLGILDLLLNSNPGTRFAKLAENLDFTKPVEFSAWHDTKDDKTAFIVRQDGQSIPQKYTRESPGGCPEPTQRGRQGKWDYTEQEDFLYERMISVVIPAVDAAEATRSIVKPATARPETSTPLEDDWGRPTPAAPSRVINAVERVTLLDAVQAKSMPPAVATEIIGRFGFAKSTDVTVDMLAEVLAAISDWRPNNNPRGAASEMAPESPREVILDLVQALENYGMATNQVYDLIERVSGVRDAAHIQAGDNEKVIATLNGEFSSRRFYRKAKA